MIDTPMDGLVAPVQEPAAHKSAAEEPGLSREEQARNLIKYYSAWSFGAGVVPVPFLDMALVMGVQVQMLRKMAAVYDTPFQDHLVKGLVGALLGGIVPEAVSMGAIGHALRALPGIGPLFGFLTMPAFSAASSYAVGQVFLQHFESGGTFLSFKPEQVRDHFRKIFENAKADLSVVKPTFGGKTA